MHVSDLRHRPPTPAASPRPWSSIRQGTGNYWNGTAFASASEVLLAASGTTNWTRSHPAANFPTDGSYTVRAVATDGAGNTGTTSRTFTIDRAARRRRSRSRWPAGTYGIGSGNAGCSVQACGTAVGRHVRCGVGDGQHPPRCGELLERHRPSPAPARCSFLRRAPRRGPAVRRRQLPCRRRPTRCGPWPPTPPATPGTASATATLDVTAPAPTGLTLGDGDGLITPTTDEVAITFSEPLVGVPRCARPGAGQATRPWAAAARWSP